MNLDAPALSPADALTRVMVELQQRIGQYERDALDIYTSPRRATIAQHRADALREAHRVVELERAEARLAE